MKKVTQGTINYASRRNIDIYFHGERFFNQTVFGAVNGEEIHVKTKNPDFGEVSFHEKGDEDNPFLVYLWDDRAQVWYWSPSVCPHGEIVGDVPATIGQSDMNQFIKNYAQLYEAEGR